MSLGPSERQNSSVGQVVGPVYLRPFHSVRQWASWLPWSEARIVPGLHMQNVVVKLNNSESESWFRWRFTETPMFGWQNIDLFDFPDHFPAKPGDSDAPNMSAQRKDTFSCRTCQAFHWKRHQCLNVKTKWKKMYLRLKQEAWINTYSKSALARLKWIKIAKSSKVC